MTAAAGMVKLHLFVPALVKVMPLAVGFTAEYPASGEHVMVTVSPTCAVALLDEALPPVPAFTVTL